jgi:hypothetical protein
MTPLIPDSHVERIVLARMANPLSSPREISPVKSFFASNFLVFLGVMHHLRHF